jgi:hypothetical protein
VTKTDDPASQRHELVGTKKVYQYLEEHEEGPILVDVHVHDRNLSINKYIRENQPNTINQNDTWHAGKSVEKQMAKVAKGPMRSEGINWHNQLFDKSASVRTHVQHAIRNCQQDPKKLRDGIMNAVQHYKNNHGSCDPAARCKTSDNYEPKKLIIQDPKAELLFEKALKSTIVHHCADDFVLGMDTFYVESFNNTLNMFQDKRIAFGLEEYTRRSQLAVCHWNENVNRPHTSMWTPPVVLAHVDPWAPKGKKTHKKRTFGYCASIWTKFMGQVYL